MISSTNQHPIYSKLTTIVFQRSKPFLDSQTILKLANLQKGHCVLCVVQIGVVVIIIVVEIVATVVVVVAIATVRAAVFVE